MVTMNKMSTDEELVNLYKEGNEGACDILLNRYKNLVRRKAKAMFIAGGDNDDLIQEGMIGLYKAIRSFDPQNDANASFVTFASMCINRQMCTAVSAANRKKHIPLNFYVSLDAPLDGENGEDSDATLSDILVTEKEQNPEALFIDQENASSVEDRLAEKLSGMEKEVLSYTLLGKNYVEIASILNRSPKSIDNAIQRIKNKLLNIL